MTLRLSSSLIFPLVFALAGCAQSARERIVFPPTTAPEHAFTQSRSNGLMPRVQASVAPTHFEGRVVSDRERRTGR